MLLFCAFKKKEPQGMAKEEIAAACEGA